MPEPIANAAVAFIEFTVVKHPFLSLTVILVFTLWASIIDAAPDVNKMDDFEFGFKHPFVTFALFPFIFVYGIFCAIVDALAIGGSGKARTAANRWGTAVCRIYAKNIKLFFRLIFGALLLISVVGAAVAILRPKSKPLPNGGGPESEKFFGFMNTITAPLQWVVNSIRFLLGILSVVWLVTVYYAGKVLAISPVVTLTAIVVVYFVWLWFTTCRIVTEEFGSKGTVAHAVVALVPAQLATWFLFLVSLGAIQSAFAWISSQIPA